MLQTERRRNPYPYTWEIPVGQSPSAAAGRSLGRPGRPRPGRTGRRPRLGLATQPDPVQQPARRAHRQRRRRAGRTEPDRATRPQLTGGLRASSKLLLLAGADHRRWCGGCGAGDRNG